MGFVQCFAQTLALDIKKDSIVYNVDEKGNRVIDFSYCGYRNSNVPLPEVKNVIFVPWNSGDNSSRIQLAIYHVASLEADQS